jgi:hypothetical protein
MLTPENIQMKSTSQPEEKMKTRKLQKYLYGVACIDKYKRRDVLNHM